MEKKCWNYKNFIILFVVTTSIFLALYHNVIWGNSTNMFTDIGCDTLFMAYPNQYIRNTMPQGGYALNFGFGRYIPGRWFTMLQPFNWIQLIVSDIVSANIISLYLEHLVTALFAYFFFRKLMHTESVTPLVCSVIWAYSGYAVLWSQHGWTINIAFVTMMLYFLQCMLLKERKGYLIVVPFFILAIHSYYFFYMDGIFAAFYVIGYAIINKQAIKECINNLVKLLCAGIMSMGIGAVGLLPGLRSYFVSARTTASTQKMKGIFQDVKYVFSTFGRVLSNDIFGNGNEYTGYYNYYEAAVLACTALLIPCIVVLLRNRKYVKQILIIGLISVVTVNMQISSYILNLDSRKPRWTYMLIFVMVLAVGYCLENIIRGDIHVRKWDLLITGVIYAVYLFILWIGDRQGIADVKRGPCLIAVIFAVCYFVILLLLSKKMCGKQVFIILMAVLAMEMVINNYGAVNKRTIVTKEELKDSLYNDGTQELLSAINDDGLYRVNKTYLSVFFNDSMVQGYNGLGIYDSVNTQNLIDFYQSFDFELMNGMTHYIYIGTDQTTLNTLLGVKYVIVKDQDVVPDGYKWMCSYGDKNLYYNENAIGFGYIYTKQMKKSQFDKFNMQDKINALSGYYYLTRESVEDNSIANIDVSNIDVERNLQSFAKNSVDRSSIEKNKLTLTVSKKEKSAMLCVPLIYDSNWKVFIDGKQESSVNINGGLTGVDLSEVSNGEHQVILKYDAKEYRYGVIISAIFLCAYIAGLIKVGWKNIQNNSNTLT